MQCQSENVHMKMAGNIKAHIKELISVIATGRKEIGLCQKNQKLQKLEKLENCKDERSNSHRKKQVG